MIVFKHIRASTNLGDTWCSPYDHVGGWPADAVALDLKDETPHCDAVIYGGGKITGGLSDGFGPQDWAAKERIAWGVSTVQKFFYAPRYRRTFKAMTLVGSRDWGDRRFDWVPCASCANPVFDLDYPETHDVVAYLHHWRAPRMGIEVPEGIPVMDNRADDFEAAIRFIASGRTVVSNSYHGVYWALLLGKRVLCLPFSNKFENYRVAPGYATAKNWQARLNEARGSDEMLGLCREATAGFAEQVRDRL